ncbi:PIG-L family deacetylase [uncultured Paludibaculum sp.]|uniref:PIG-L family deacetylase n=1 Tax=uncultured Paludibaculum sp. TaxID=1765020 RepID=UPI002AAB8C56|nr:PIG-L family deacetylase [uncultured Paludibaculum sp.]
MTQLTRKEFVIGLASAAGLPAIGPPKVLLVFAHPDDESVVAATVYRLTHELGAIVDHVIITNGEGGYRYSKLAESLYGTSLSEEAVGRARLPEIRQKETRSAGKLLGVRKHFFLHQRDERFTLDSREALDRLWDTALVRNRLVALLEEERYQAVITLYPEPSTHGHHQAAAMLVLEAVAALPGAARPAVLGAVTSPAGPDPRADFVLDRHTPLAQNHELDYSIIVNWVIAEHKSQGLLQRDCNRFDREVFHLLNKERQAAAQAIFQRLDHGERQ